MAIPREPQSLGDSVETTRQLPKQITKAYMLGLLHDATERKTTYRIGQKNKRLILNVAKFIKKFGCGAWIYKEGKDRDLYILEFSKSFLVNTKIKSLKDKIDYIRGYFDAEGGIAKSNKVRFYIYFAQKDFKDLKQVKNYLKETKISCGKTHNPSKIKDPHYWRFFVSAKSYKRFAKIIGSCHPEKSYLLGMKI